jgi:integration host factor subunit alpha
VRKNNLTKNDIAKSLSQKTGFSKQFSKKLINELIIVLLHELKNDVLHLKNIGTFKVTQKKERVGRNPKTMEEFKIISRKSISFTPSKKLLYLNE